MCVSVCVVKENLCVCVVKENRTHNASMGGRRTNYYAGTAGANSVVTSLLLQARNRSRNVGASRAAR